MIRKAKIQLLRDLDYCLENISNNYHYPKPYQYTHNDKLLDSIALSQAVVYARISRVKKTLMSDIGDY